MDRSLLRGFWHSISSCVPVLWFHGMERLWFWVSLKSQFSPLCVLRPNALFFCCPWKAAQYLVGDGVKPLSAGSVVAPERWDELQYEEGWSGRCTQWQSVPLSWLRRVYILTTLHAHCRLLHVLGERRCVPCCLYSWTWPHHVEHHWLQWQRKGGNGELYLILTSFCSEYAHTRAAQISLFKICHLAMLNSKWVGRSNPTVCPEGRRWARPLDSTSVCRSPLPRRQDTRIWQGLSRDSRWNLSFLVYEAENTT